MHSRRAIQKSLRTTFDPGPRWWAKRALLRGRQALHAPVLLGGGRLDRPIFVIGAPRSGTSLLFAILRSSSRLAHWPGEAHEVWEAHYHPALRNWDSNVLDASDVTEQAAAYIKRQFLLIAGSRRRLIDKTPRNALRCAFIEALWPDARYVFLQRDGRDNVNSLINAWRTPRYRTYRLPEPHSIPGVDPAWWKFVLYSGWRADASGPLEVVCAKQWATCNEHALAAAKTIDRGRWIEIRYEDLVADPASSIDRVMERLELPYEDGVRRRAEATTTTPINVVTPPERGKWRKENPGAIESVLPLLAPTMEALGYPQG
ncbi:MAG: sulfotransferase [Actinomycetota bacterium]|nr:sulfotransferase [Actinomycetota bacterium]